MFAILFEALLLEIQEEIPHFAGWEGGGSNGHKSVNKTFVNKLAFPIQGRTLRPEGPERLLCLLGEFSNLVLVSKEWMASKIHRRNPQRKPNTRIHDGFQGMPILDTSGA